MTDTGRKGLQHPCHRLTRCRHEFGMPMRVPLVLVRPRWCLMQSAFGAHGASILEYAVPLVLPVPFCAKTFTHRIAMRAHQSVPVRPSQRWRARKRSQPTQIASANTRDLCWPFANTNHSRRNREVKGREPGKLRDLQATDPRLHGGRRSSHVLSWGGK